MTNNKNDAHIKYRLRQWASWVFYSQTTGLNFPPKTLLAKLCESKGELIRGTGPLDFDNEEAEEMDAVIQELMERKPKHAQVIKEEYLTHPQTKREDKANAVELSVTRYKHYLEVAWAWIDARLYQPEQTDSHST